MLRKIATICFAVSFIVFLSGCDYTRQVNEMAYVVGMGIDKGESGNLLLSLQFAKPMAIAGKSGGGDEEEGKTENKATSLVSSEGNDIFSALSIIESSLSKQINLTHTKLLLFSDEISSEGISKYVYTLMGNNQFRPNTYASVAKGGAKEYFEKVKPALELNPAKYYTLMFSKDTKSFMPSSTLKDLYFNINSKEASAVLPVVGTTEEKKEKDTQNAENFVAGNSTKEDENKTESSGMALFKGDKLLSIEESKDAEIFNIITGKFKEGYVSFSDDKGKNPISLHLKARKKPKINVKLSGEKIEAQVDINLTAELISYSEDSKINFSQLEAKVCEEITKKADSFTQRTKELGCDVLGFGRNAKKNFLTYPEWENYNWAEKFPKINVKYNVKLKIKGGNLID